MGRGVEMKKLLKELYLKKKRDFDVWNYLWVFSDDSNIIVFNPSELCGRFNIPPSSLHRILNKYPEDWNGDKTFVEYERLKRKEFKVIFHPKGKKLKKTSTQPVIYDELFNWLKQHYKNIAFDYQDLNQHKHRVKTICDKVTKAMKDKNTEITDESVKDTFKYIFLNMPQWWVDNGNITLPLVSKHFTKILNQVKNQTNGKKRDSYSKAAETADGIDFEKVANA